MQDVASLVFLTVVGMYFPGGVVPKGHPFYEFMPIYSYWHTSSIMLPFYY